MGKRKKIAARAVLVVAISMIVIGIVREEVIEVFTKAIYICLECVGIG